MASVWVCLGIQKVKVNISSMTPLPGGRLAPQIRILFLNTIKMHENSMFEVISIGVV